MIENVWKIGFIADFKISTVLWAPVDSTYQAHVFWHKNRDFSWTRTQVIAKYVISYISMVAIFNMAANM